MQSFTTSFSDHASLAHLLLASNLLDAAVIKTVFADFSTLFGFQKPFVTMLALHSVLF